MTIKSVLIVLVIALIFVAVIVFCQKAAEDCEGHGGEIETHQVGTYFLSECVHDH